MAKSKKKYVALKDFNSLGTKKSYKRGMAVNEDAKYLKEWEKLGFIKVEIVEKSKEDKTPTKTK